VKAHLEHPIFKIIASAAEEMGIDAYVIGGFVRDIFLNRPSKDIDIMTVGSGIELAKKVSALTGKEDSLSVFGNYGTAMITYKDLQIEFVGARKESYSESSRNPEVESGTLSDDQNRRDFTINAMAISLRQQDFGALLDPFNGLGDLKNKIIRTPLDAGITFSDDPLRMMRAIRFSTQLNFTIHPFTREAIKRNKARISIVSKERISDELNKIILCSKPSDGIKQLDETGLLELIFPQFVALKGAQVIEGKGHKDNFYHTLEVLDRICKNTDNLWLRWAALLHDIAKPATKQFDPQTGWTFHNHEFKGSKMVPSIFAQLKLPLNEKMKYVQKLVLLHLRPIVLAEGTVTDSAVRRLLFEAGDDIDDLMTLCEADITSKNQEKVKRYLGNFELVRSKLKEIEEKDRIRNWQPPVTGEIIMQAFGIPPGREVGIIKTAIREAILDGIIHNDYDEAYKLMLDEGTKLGLKISGNASIRIDES
jgi:poly(A) polymerase